MNITRERDVGWLTPFLPPRRLRVVIAGRPQKVSKVIGEQSNEDAF